ncbi:MAG: hypothetical protein ACRC1P_09880 [Cellulosilyticaceae bacterium]
MINKMYTVLTGIELEDLAKNKGRMTAALREACIFATGGRLGVENRLEKINEYK